MLEKLRPPEELPTLKATDVRRKWNEFVSDLRKLKFIAIVDNGNVVVIAIEPTTYHRVQKAAIAREQRRQKAQILTVFQITRKKLSKIMSLCPGENENIERWTDIYLGTLRTFLQDIGGDLNIEIHLGDNSVKIESFEEMLPINKKT